MSTPFQNRLVGTIIVAAVVIIFLPDVLDGEKKSHQTEFEAIPKAEVFSGKIANKPFPEERLTRQPDTLVVDEAPIDDKLETDIAEKVAVHEEKLEASIKASNQEKAKPPESLTSNIPEKAIANEAWVIHLGSFKNKDNVEHLVTKLKANGYVVFTKPIQTKQGTLTKVIIGPELIKSAMEKKLTKLKQLTNIQGKVAYFEVNK